MEELRTIGGLAQLGSFGLICFLFWWATRTIPQHFADLAKERSNREQVLMNITGVFQVSLEKMTGDHTTREERLVSSWTNREEKLITAWSEESRRNRELAKELADTERKECSSSHKELAAMVGSLVEEIRKQHAEMVARYDVSHEKIREVKHELANIAQARANERSLAAEQKGKPRGATSDPPNAGGR